MCSRVQYIPMYTVFLLIQKFVMIVITIIVFGKSRPVTVYNELVNFRNEDAKLNPLTVGICQVLPASKCYK